LQRLDEMNGDERADYLLATGYHPHMSRAWCGASLQNGMAPPTKIPHGTSRSQPYADPSFTRSRPRADALAKGIRPPCRARAGCAYRTSVRGRPAPKDAPARFRWASRPSIKGYQLGLADCPVASQAAELLDRVSVAASKLLGTPVAH
jgi:hypothetical protein